jgi:hypothetical protein
MEKQHGLTPGVTGKRASPEGRVKVNSLKLPSGIPTRNLQRKVINLTMIGEIKQITWWEP